MSYGGKERYLLSMAETSFDDLELKFTFESVSLWLVYKDCRSSTAISLHPVLA
jgi:hypothetical protein